MAKTSDISFTIEKQIELLSENPKNGWRKELNLVSWNGREAKYDIRDWDAEHTKMGKGVTLTDEEAELLKNALVDIFES